MRRSFTVAPGGWAGKTLSFEAPATDPDAKLEITFSGPGTVWLGSASLLPSDHFHGMREDVVALLERMSAPLLRWPGGNFSGDYIWQDGLLPVDQRPSMMSNYHRTLALSDNWDHHELGTDEFIALCRRLGSEPTITINIDPAACPPELAAAWVQDRNGPADSQWGALRAERGHPEPYGVKDRSIGNEIYGEWMQACHCDPPEYARRIAAYAEAMREVDPSIVLMVAGNLTLEDWDRDLIALAGGDFDIISEHEYASEEGAHDVPLSYDDVTRLARWPREVTRARLLQSRQTADQAAPAGKRIGISFDEWNVWHNWFTMPFENEWHVSAIDGVYTAAMLHMLCREAEATGLEMAAYFEPVNEGAIAVMPVLGGPDRGRSGLRAAERSPGPAHDRPRPPTRRQPGRPRLAEPRRPAGLRHGREPQGRARGAHHALLRERAGHR